MRKNLVTWMVLMALLISTVLAVTGTVCAQTLEWDRVDPGGGFGDVKNQGVWSMSFLGDDLYAGTYNFDTGTEIWRNKEGSWSQVNTNGFGDSHNYNSSSMAVYKNRLYAGTFNDPLLGGTGCQVLRSNTSGTSWVRVDPGSGFGDPNNTDASSMAVYDDQLYVGTFNQAAGCRIRRYNGSNWALADPGGGFGDINNFGARSMAVYKNCLYVGTFNISTGAEVWRYNGTNWTKVNTDGFGDNGNTSCPSMCVYDNALYVGTKNDITGAEVWKYNGTAWSQVNKGGFGDKTNVDIDSMAVYDDGSGENLYAGTFITSSNSGCHVWGYDGSKWSMANVNGFGSTSNDTASSMAVSGSDFYVGTDNATSGCEVWSSSAVTEESAWYLAEGTTAWDFETYISIENPNAEVVTANVTYMPTGQDNVQESLALPAQSQTTLTNGHLVEVMGGMRDFSTKVECAEGKTIAVDRTMSWTGPGAASPDGHCSVGVTAPSKFWYLPEGSTNWGFETFLLVQNPGDTDATCTVTYMIENEDPQSFTKAVPANSRATYNMANDIGEKDASIKVESDVPVICERAMYRNSRREGHDSIGTTTPAKDYYLAEGTTAIGFTTFVLIQNPNDTEASVDVTYMVSGEGAVPHPGNPVVMPPNSRRTLRINNVLPDKDFSTHVHGDKPIISERAMYWDNGMGEACHDSIGMSSPHTTFYLPDGQTTEGRETFTLIQNPNDTAVNVDVTYMTPTGEGNVTKTVTVNANSRITFNMLEHSGIEGRAAIMVTSTTADKKIMAERAMYWNGRNAGTDTIGGFSD